MTPLWSLSFSNKSTSYLFGTMHVKDARAFKYFDYASELISSCTQFYTEINFEHLSNAQMNAAQFLPEGQTMIDLLGQKKYDKAAKVLIKHFNCELVNFNHYLPIVTVNAILARHLNQEFKQNLDQSLFNFAKSQGLICSGLESVENQISLLQSISLKLQLKQFKELVANPGKHKKQIAKLTELYLVGDIFQLYKSSKKSMGSLRKKLIYDRNYNMADKIIENKNNPSFYAIGAGHLAGKHGVLKILKEKGASLKPLKLV